MTSSFSIDILNDIMKLAPGDKYKSMLTLHFEIKTRYCSAIQGFSSSQASQIASDGRTLQQVVGHIMEWERFTLFCLVQLISGIRNASLIWENGYVDLDGKPHTFATIDEFNAFQTPRQLNQPWNEIQTRAVYMSETLFQLLGKSGLVTPELLDGSEVIKPKLSDGSRFPVPLGYYLWWVILEHEAADHAVDLYPQS